MFRIKTIIFLFISLTTFSACSTRTESKSITKYDADSSETFDRSPGIKAFNEDEKLALDSAMYYKVSDLVDSCFKYIYVHFAMYNLQGKTTTIGECNIRLINLSSISDAKKDLIFGVFINDSIPAGFRLKLEPQSDPMIDGFVVNTRTHKIEEAYVGYGRMTMGNVLENYNLIIKEERFIQYLNDHKNTIHPKFKRLLKL